MAHRRRRGDTIRTFKIIKGIEDIPSGRFFKLCTSSSTGGHSLKLEKPSCKTFRLQQFSQRIIKDWNSLPDGAVLAKDLNEFKSKILTNTGTTKSFMFIDQLICQFDIYFII